MPLAHQKYLYYSAEEFQAWAQSVGEQTNTVIKLFLAAGLEPEQGYKACRPLWTRITNELSRHLACPYDEYIRSDILSDLGRRYIDHPAYQVYIQLLYNNQDPMETDECCEHICRLANDHDDSEY